MSNVTVMYEVCGYWIEVSIDSLDAFINPVRVLVK